MKKFCGILVVLGFSTLIAWMVSLLFTSQTIRWAQQLKHSDVVSKRRLAAEGLEEYVGTSTLLDSEIRTVVPALAEALKDPDDSVRRSAAIALSRIGSAGQIALPFLIMALEDSNPPMQFLAAEAIINIGPSQKAAVPAYIKALSHEDRFVRKNAAFAIGRFGPDAKSGIPALCKAVNDEDKGVRTGATSSLGKIGPDPRSVKALVSAMKDESPQIRQVALGAIKRMAPTAQAAFPAVFQALNDPDSKVASDASMVLMAVQPGEEHIPLLAKALKNPSKNIRMAAIAFLESFVPDVIPDDRDWAEKDKDEMVAKSAANILKALREMGLLKPDNP